MKTRILIYVLLAAAALGVAIAAPQEIAPPRLRPPRASSRLIGGMRLAPLSSHTLKGTQPVVAQPVIGSQECRICHGYDFDPDHFVEPYDTWTGTMMAQAGRDPLFWSALDVANHDEPGFGDFCLRCHTPAGWLEGRSEPPKGSTDGCGLQGPIDSPYAADFDGVTCHVCHRMMVNEAPPPGEQPYYLENAQYWIDDSDCDGDGEPCRRGPYEYEGTNDSPPPHPHRYSPYHQEAQICGTCHNVTNPVRNLIVGGVDQGIKFPIERTHREWERSAYAVPGPSQTPCQTCHMLKVTDDPVWACVFEENNRTNNLFMHAFVGGNTFAPELIRQSYPALGLDDAITAIQAAATDMLQHRSATVEVAMPGSSAPGATLPVQVKVTNLTGHKLPTGYPEGRRMWLHLTAREGNGPPFWESGAYDPASGVLTQDAAVKIYRADQGVWNLNGANTCDHVDTTARPVFHFARNDCIVLDNRIPPLGFQGGGDIEVRPVGYVYPETSPGSGTLVNYDVTSYSVPVPASAALPITVTAELRYQTTSKEYVDFQKDQAVANSFPDDCIERTGGPVNTSRGELLHDLWSQNGRSAPVTMGTDSRIAPLAGQPGPGEASRTTSMRVTSYDGATGDITISYQPSCSSTNHTVYVGDLAAVSSMSFSSAFCNLGTSGVATFRPSGTRLFWLIVGNNGVKEGSYGRNSSGVERPESAGLGACDLPRDLSNACTP